MLFKKYFHAYIVEDIEPHLRDIRDIPKLKKHRSATKSVVLRIGDNFTRRMVLNLRLDNYSVYDIKRRVGLSEKEIVLLIEYASSIGLCEPLKLKLNYSFKPLDKTL